MHAKESTTEEKPKRKPRRKSTPWFFHDFFKYAAAILLSLTIIFIFYQVAFLLKPVFDFISILFTPVIISFFVYYLLRPLVYALENIKVPRFISILVIYLLVGLLLIFFIAYLGPILAEQISAIANISVATLEKIKTSSKSMFFHLFNVNLDYEIEQRLFSAVQQLMSILTKNFGDLVSFITHLAVILAVIPFIVFYLLKNDQEFASGFLKHVPTNFGPEARNILHNIDSTLSSYISGLITVSSCVGAMLFVGYLIIGLNYALILSFIALIFMTIPFLGPFLAITPAFIVGLTQSPFMALKVVIVFVIVQQIESNILSPQIIGQRLNIHPLTIILLLLAAGSLYGLIGLILATPFYAISKVILQNLYKIYQLRYSNWKKDI